MPKRTDKVVKAAPVAAKSPEVSPMIRQLLASLEAFRQKRGLSIEKFVAPAGVSDQTWAYWRRGDNAPNFGTLERLLTAHHLSLTVSGDGVDGADGVDGTPSKWPEDVRRIAEVVEACPSSHRSALHKLILLYLSSLAHK